MKEFFPETKQYTVYSTETPLHFDKNIYSYHILCSQQCWHMNTRLDRYKTRVVMTYDSCMCVSAWIFLSFGVMYCQT